MIEQSQPTPVNTPTTDATIQKFYYLIAGNVVYKVPGTDGQNTMGVISLNGLITSDNAVLRVSDLNKAQQVLQHHFRTKVEDATLEVADVIILNVVALGFQSENEFNNLSMGLVQ